MLLEDINHAQRILEAVENGDTITINPDDTDVVLTGTVRRIDGDGTFEGSRVIFSDNLTEYGMMMPNIVQRRKAGAVSFRMRNK